MNQTLAKSQPPAFDTPWIEGVIPNPDTKLRLFCLPFAGGAANVFRLWSRHLPDWVELCPIQLPGRGRRLEEKAYPNWRSIVEELAPALLPYLDRPFMIFGHSMGALLSFELARSLRRNYSQLPEVLFVSGLGAPQIFQSPKNPIHQFSDEQLIKKLKSVNGTPEAVLQQEELMQLFMPMLRADLAVVETYEYHEEAPLHCPILAFGGTHDSEVSQQELAQWSQQSSVGFSYHMLPGDHFFLQSAKEELLQLMSNAIEKHISL